MDARRRVGAELGTEGVTAADLRRYRWAERGCVATIRCYRTAEGEALEGGEARGERKTPAGVCRSGIVDQVSRECVADFLGETARIRKG